MALIDFDSKAELCFLDTRDHTEPFDVLVWDQRTGVVHLFVESGWTFHTDDDGGPDWSRSSRTVERVHQDRFIVHAANVPFGEPVPTVSEMLAKEARIIVGIDGEVTRRFGN